ncbi:MAG TPA: flagellar biosynthesis protein FlhB [Xanthobacteraceae bacterium]|nr:flagellar biosynthesis protein FlhB [Xanthobacteraceae bacterium]
MAEDSDDTEKTEDPTQKRLEEALRRGDVVKSQEVNTWFIIAAATLILMAFSGPMGSDLTTTFRGILGNAYAIPPDGGDLMRLTRRLSAEVLAAVAIPFLLLALAAIGGNLIQHRLVWSTEGLQPKFSKISPMAGLKRLFSKQALANFVKGLLKLALVGSVLVALLWPERRRLEGLVATDPVAIMPFIRTLSLQLLGAVVAILAIVAAADYLFQYRQWFERQKMSLREMKEEFRQTEGDPKVKAKIRQLRQTRMRKRMMAAVPQATVVITNPTHFAVALQYEKGMTAPVCVAKGQDLIALKIREVAQRSAVPIVENPPLARVLHATVEVDQEIPPEHYRAVAEVIGYVMRLNRAVAR